MNIRPARPEDLEAAASIIDQCALQLHEQGIAQWDNDYPGRERLAEDIRNDHMLAGIADGKIVAILTVGSEEDFEYHRHISWEVEDGPAIFFNRLAVDPACQGQGLARRLMDFAETRAERTGYRSVRLDVHADNSRILAWLLRRGFCERGTTTYGDASPTYRTLELTIPLTTIHLVTPPFPTASYAAWLFSQATAIRRAVFIEEQGVSPVIEQDGRDIYSEHMVAVRGNEAVGCLRMRRYDADSEVVKLERIAILPRYRRLGLGKQLVREALELCTIRGCRSVLMHAQCYLLDYYRALGFRPIGDRFLEADIEHITMVFAVPGSIAAQKPEA